MRAGPIDVPEAVLAAQQNGELVIFAGAGVSMGPPSKLPSFLQLVRKLARGTGVKVDRRNLDVTLGRLVDRKLLVHEDCRDIIANKASRPNPIHRQILKLFSEPRQVRIVTTNFDRHFARAAKRLRLKLPEFHAPALPLGHDFCGLVHLHGSVEEAARTLILTDRDFGRAYLGEGWARNFLHGLFTTYTVLFVGYSHSDPPVHYLARGMSSRGMKPRFAFTTAKDAEIWTPLDITPVLYPAAGGDHSALGKGIARWIEIVSLQPLEVEDRLRQILTAPESRVPEPADVDFIRRCLGDPNTAHYFSQHAQQPRWLYWLHEQRLLKPLLGDTAGPQPRHLELIGNWASRKLVHEATGRGRWLLHAVGGRLNPNAWHAAMHELWTNAAIDFSTKEQAQWVIILTDPIGQPVRGRLLAYVLEKLAELKRWELACHLLATFLTTRSLVEERSSWEVVPEAERTADLEPRLIGRDGDVRSVWHQHFHPALTSIAATLLPVLEDRLRQAEREHVALGRDPASLIYGRPHIAARLHPHDRSDPAGIIDYLGDVVDALAAQAPEVLATKARDWLNASSPALLRFGMHGLAILPGVAAAEKVELLRRRDLIFPDMEGARSETLAVLQSAYPLLTDGERRVLWSAIEAGPSAHWSRHLTEGVEDMRRAEIRWLAARLSAGKSDAPAEEARARLGLAPESERAEAPVEEDVEWRGGDQSPLTADQILARPAGEQIDYFLGYKGEWPRSADGLAAAVVTAAKQNLAWAEALLRALAERDAWEHPIWHRVFWQLEWKQLTVAFQRWLIGVAVAHADELPDLDGPARLFFDGETFEPAPDPEVLAMLEDAAVRWWPRVIRRAPAEEKSDLDEEWTSRAINSAVGRIVEFWIRQVDHTRPDRKMSPGAWPPRIAPFFDEMAEGQSYGAKLGLAVVAQQMGFVRFVAPEWARTKLFPWLDVTTCGDRAFVVWKPFLFYGRLSRDLILELPPYFQKAFSRFAVTEEKLAKRFGSFVGIIAHSGLWNIRRKNWLDTFIRVTPVELRAHWAREIGRFLDEASIEDRRAAWHRWLKRYWEDRNRGRPCPLEPVEAEAMADWVLALQPIREIWTLATTLRFEPGEDGEVLWDLARDDASKRAPDSIVQFLEWILPKFKRAPHTLDSVVKVIERLPRDAELQPGLRKIVQELSRLGYQQAAELRKRIDQWGDPAGE